MVTICGRALSHCQVSSVERAYGSATLDFWLRHEWLDGILSRAIDSLAINTPVVPAVADPMLFFAFMMAHATTIYMCQIAEASSAENQCRPTVVDYRNRATRAAKEIASLAKAHEHIGYFKVRQVLDACHCGLVPRVANALPHEEGPHIPAGSRLARRIATAGRPNARQPLSNPRAGGGCRLWDRC